MKISKIVLCLSIMFTAVIFSACGQGSVPELTQKILEKTAPEIIKEDIYFDQMANMEFQFQETTEDEMNVLMKTFDYAVPYQSVHCTSNISSISMDAFIEYNIVYVYNNVEWKPIYCYAVNEEKWEYDSKEFATLKQIMNDIKQFPVGNFEKGYVGNENNSSITITNRNYEKQVNRDTVNCQLTVTTDFGTYVTNISAVYYFKKGKWEIGDFIIPDMSEWTFTYSPDISISLINDGQIIKKLTTKNEFLTYITNPKYMSSNTLTQTGMEASADNVIYHYRYDVEYKKIGTISYMIDVVYDWLSFEWSEPTINISANSQEMNKMVNKKYEKGNQYVMLKSFRQYDKSIKDEYDLNDEIDLDEHSSFAEAEYFDGTELHNILLNIVILLRDDDYEMRVLKEIQPENIEQQGEVSSSRFKEFDKIRLFVSNNTLQVEDRKFSLK